MGNKSRTVYSKEYKENAVRMVVEEGRRVSEVARDLGINPNLIFQWKNRYFEKQEQNLPDKSNSSSEAEYVRQLERKVKRLEEERDILKKATIFFAKEPL
jgi:transposase